MTMQNDSPPDSAGRCQRPAPALLPTFTAADVEVLRASANFTDNTLAGVVDATTPTPAGERLRQLAEAIARVVDQSATAQASALRDVLTDEHVNQLRALSTSWSGVATIERRNPARARAARERSRDCRLLARRLEAICGSAAS